MRIFFLVSALLMLGVSSAVAQQTPSRGSRIAFITDLSGPGAYWAKSSSLGAKMAAQDLRNAGQAAEVLLGDHKFSTSTAVAEVQRLLHGGGADALFVEFAPTVIATSPIAKTNKALFIGMSAAVSVLESNPYAFKAYLDYRKGCRAAAEHWKQSGVVRAGVLLPIAEFGELCLQGVKEVFPDPVNIAEYEIGADLRTQILVLKRSGVQAIFAPALEGDVLRLLQGLEQLHFMVPIASSESDGLRPQVLAKFGRQLEGALSFGFPEVAAEFRRRFVAQASVADAVPEAAALAYLHIKQLARAVASCPEGDIECQVRELEGSEPDATMGFLGWNDRVAEYNYQLKRVEDGQLRVVSTFGSSARSAAAN